MTDPHAAHALAPIELSQRIRGVDIARGLALLGILLVNARFFFGTLAVALHPEIMPAGLTPTYTDFVAWSLVEFFCTYKCMSLFSLLFGFGIAMQVERVRAAGGNRFAFGARRFGVLAVIGVIHGTLVWYGDILTLYSVLGFMVLALTMLSTKAILRVFAVIVSVLLLLTLATTTLGYFAASHPEWFGLPNAGEAVTPEAAVEDLRGMAAMTAANFDIGSPAWRAAETAAFSEGPFMDALLFRSVSFGMSLAAAIIGYGWHALAMMLLGVYAFRSGLFLPEASQRRRRIAKLSFAVGFPLMTLAVLPLWICGIDDPAALALHTAGLELGGLVLPIGYAVSIVEWSPKLPRMLAVALERTGRMTLSVYLAESLVCVTLASWWGFAWFGTLLDAQMLVLALVVWAALVMLASLWLRTFSIGPMERLWRAATYKA